MVEGHCNPELFKPYLQSKTFQPGTLKRQIFNLAAPLQGKPSFLEPRLVVSGILKATKLITLVQILASGPWRFLGDFG